jgi:hypothetical protein
MRVTIYLALLLLLNGLMATASWGSAYLSLVIVITYLVFRPTRVLHPNNMLFGFFGLYVVLPSNLSLVLDLIEWAYSIPWIEVIQWGDISKYALFQAEFTFLILYLGIHFFSKERAGRCSVRPQAGSQRGRQITRVSTVALAFLSVFVLCLVLWFIQATAGLDAWLNDYSYTYLTKREGYGLLNVIIIAVGNAVIFLLGLKSYQAKSKLGTILWALLIMLALSYVNGVKARFIFLLLLFLSPYLMHMENGLKRATGFAAAFFGLLYLGTLVRTEGFYAAPAYFLEMMIGYFNSYPLHDYVVTSRDPALFQTVGQLFTKPLQLMGLADADANFDISVMLTKEFFPEQWYREHATQQWPLDTELYLNYCGPWLSWMPLLVYAVFISWLYRATILRGNVILLPIYVMEFQRLFSMMRGTLIPWEFPIYVAQYLFLYMVCQAAIQSKTPSSGVVQKGQGAHA